MKQRIISILLLVLILAVSYERGVFRRFSGGDEGQDGLSHAYENRVSNIQVQGAGIVEKILKDDTEGSAHQRFILRVGPEQTVLIAHNIDLAPRVENLRQGDRLEFYGEYEWNDKGGVVHWTHRDPDRNHRDGWIIHNGERYE